MRCELGEVRPLQAGSRTTDDPAVDPDFDSGDRGRGEGPPSHVERRHGRTGAGPGLVDAAARLVGEEAGIGAHPPAEMGRPWHLVAGDAQTAGYGRDRLQVAKAHWLSVAEIDRLPAIGGQELIA